MLILGFDCANKSLGISIVSYQKTWKENLYKCLSKQIKILEKNPKKVLESLSKIKSKLDQAINILYSNAFDLIPNKKLKESTPLERSIALRHLLENIDRIIESYEPSKLELVLIESQMRINTNSNDICSKIMYHYCFRTKNIFTVGAGLKQKIAYAPHLKYSFFIQKYDTTYYANKKHSEENFYYWMENFGRQDIIKNIEYYKNDDAADSFNMIVAYIKFRHI